MTDIVDTGPVVWPTWCYSTKEQADMHTETEAQNENNNNNNTVKSTVNSNKRKRMKKSVPVDRHGKCSSDKSEEMIKQVKSERTSPCNSSPDNNGSPREFLLSPQIRGAMFSQSTPNIHSAGIENCGMNVAAGMRGPEPPRNYSDFIRSLAAKYNNGPDDGFPLSNGMSRSFDSKYPFKPLPPSLFGLGNKDNDPVRKSDLTSDQPSMVPSTFGFGAFSGFPMIDLSSTQALLSMVRSANSQNGSNLEPFPKPQDKRPHELGTNPLDLSNPLEKKPRMALSLSPHSSNFKELFGLKTPPTPPDQTLLKSAEVPGLRISSNCVSKCGEGSCSASREEVDKWSVEEVCKFVGSIELCAEYVTTFREHSIDGSALLYLTEDHLTNKMNLKLGPALKLRTNISSKLGSCPVCLHCVHCHGPSNRAQDV